MDIALTSHGSLDDLNSSVPRTLPEPARMRRAAHAHAQSFSRRRCAGRRLELYERALRLRSGAAGGRRGLATTRRPSADTST